MCLALAGKMCVKAHILLPENMSGNCERFSASDVDGQYIQKRAPTQWQVALILYILPIHCYQKGSIAIAKKLSISR